MASGEEKESPSHEVGRIQAVYAERERLLYAKWDETNPGNRLLAHECSESVERLLSERLQRPLSECRVLDVGCGYGGLLGALHRQGVPSENLFGVDLLPNRIEVARKSFPTFTLLEGNAEELDFPRGSFDLVSTFTVFSSILDRAMARNVAESISRVLANPGVVLWYDMRYPNPWNPHLKAMTRRRIQELFPSFALELESLTLIPPMARRLGRLTDFAYPLLSAVPLLRSHYLGLLRSGQSAHGA